MGSRYINNLTLNIASTDVENAIQAYLRGNDFKMVSEKGEKYYKTGGLMLPLRGFKYSYQEGILHLEAWVGKIGKEINIGDGRTRGFAIKVPYYNSILSLMETFEKVKSGYQQPNSQVQSEMQFQDSIDTHQFEGNNHAASAVAIEVNNANNRNAMIAFWLSIASLLLVFGARLGLLINLFSYALAIKYGLKSEKSGFAAAAIVINSITIAIALLIIFL